MCLRWFHCFHPMALLALSISICLSQFPFFASWPHVSATVSYLWYLYMCLRFRCSHPWLEVSNVTKQQWTFHDHDVSHHKLHLWYCMISFNLSVTHHVGYLTKGSKMSRKRGKNAKRIPSGLYDLATELCTSWWSPNVNESLVSCASCIFIIECPAKIFLASNFWGT